MILWQFGQTEVSDLQMWKRCWFKVMWPVHNWNNMDDCLQLRPEIRQMYFLDGVELSMDFSSFSLGEAFQWCSHCFLILLLWLCQRAEMLSGKHFLRNFGGNLASLNSPWAGFFLCFLISFFVRGKIDVLQHPMDLQVNYTFWPTFPATTFRVSNHFFLFCCID